MNKYKTVLIAVSVLFLVLIVTVFLTSKKTETDESDFLSTSSNSSSFASHGEINDSDSTGGYTPLELDVSTCQPGRDAAYFGLGHTEFLVEGKENNQCLFKHGTEIENPRWDGKLNVTCVVPVTQTINLTVTNQGIDFTPIKQYCSSI